MQVAVHRGFFKSLDALSQQDRRRTEDAMDKAHSDHQSAGLHREKVMNGYVSLRAGDDIRIIAKQYKGRLLLLHVAHHDDAYLWAERHPIVHIADSDVYELFTLLERTDVQGEAYPLSITYGDDLRQRLLSNHILPSIASKFCTCRSDDDALSMIESMSPEWQHVILKALAGGTLTPAEIPSGSSSVHALSSDASLTEALKLPFSAWRLFLHPNQKAIVENLSDRVTAVLGGPGTGKSVVVAHRAVFLAKRMRPNHASVVFTYSQNLADDVRDMVLDLQRLERAEQETSESRQQISVFGLFARNGTDAEKLPISIEGNHVMMTRHGRTFRVDAVTVDEFQDCPVWFISFLRQVVAETDCQFITVALDPQQTIFTMGNSASINEFISLSKATHLTHSYRMTRELVEHSFSVLSRYVPEYSEFMQMGQGFRTWAMLSGPNVRYVSADTENALIARARDAIDELEAKYPDSDDVALVHLQYWSPHFRRKAKSDPVADRLLADESLKKHYQFGFWTKGKEFVAGVVVCPANFMNRDLGPDNLMRLNTMFVSLTRFRQELIIVYQPESPVARYLAID